MKRILIAALLAIGSSALPTAQAVVVYSADNEGFALGSTPPTTGAPDAPTSIDPNLSLIVEDGSTVTGANLGPDQFLRLGENAGEAPDFQYDTGTSYTSGMVNISMDLLFEDADDHHVYLRESGSAAVSVANIFFRPDLTMSVTSDGGTSSSVYALDTAYLLEIMLDLNAETMDVSLNGSLITSGQGIDDVFGSVWIGFEFESFTDPVSGGFMQVDNFTVSTTEVSAPATALLMISVLGAVGVRRRSVRAV